MHEIREGEEEENVSSTKGEGGQEGDSESKDWGKGLKYRSCIVRVKNKSQTE